MANNKKPNTAEWLAVVCIVADRNKATELIKWCNSEILAKCLTKLQWLLKQDNEFINKDKSRIKELCEEISAELSMI